MISVPRNDGNRRAPSTPPAAAPSETRSGPVLTSTAAELLKAEVERLRGLMEREFTERRREAAAVDHGDDDARLAIGEDELVVRARISQLESLLHQAHVIDHQPSGTDVVGLGTRVTLEDVASGRTSTHLMVAWHDGAGGGTVSVASPVGQAILGRAAGEEVAVELPGGRSRRLRIAAVEAVDADVADIAS